MDKENSYSPKYPVTTLEKALDIIEILSQETMEGLGISELSRRLDIGKSTIHRILDTLGAYGYVDKLSNRSNYRLSWKLYEIGSVVPRQRSLSNFDNKVLQDLCDKYQETINFGVRVQNDVVILHKAEPQTVLRANLSVGVREPLYATSLGKVLLMQMDDEAVRDILGEAPLRAQTPNTIINIDALLAELVKVREQGYAIDDQEYCVGLSCIAMPLRNYEGEIVAAISVSGPSARMNFSKIMDIKEGLGAVCKNLSEHLGYNDRR